VKRYAELRGNPENSRIKNRLDNTNWYQERGTSSIEARPYMRPAAERVQADPEAYARRVASSQGIDLSSEDGLLRAVALAVQNEGKRIANQKGIRDTGALIASISIEKIQ
jgi:hypothetical protein